MKHYFKEPLVQFLIIGACIYAAYSLFGQPDAETADRTITISEARIESLATMWQKRWNRPPTDAELVGLVRAWLREDLLYREALAMGLDNDDHIIRRRLAQKLEFLTNDLVRMQEPTDVELETFLAENMERFQAPDLVTFAQVFFNPDTRGDATLDDAAAALERLRGADDPAAAAANEGDRLMLRGEFVEASEMDIRRTMGTGFAESVMQLEPGKWHGPVLSGFGTHLVYVYRLDAAPPPVLADVRDEVVIEWQRMQTEQFDQDFIDSLKGRYDIVIEGSAAFAESVISDDGADEVLIPDGPPAS